MQCAQLLRLFHRCPLLLDRSEQLINIKAVFYSIGLPSVYIDRGLKRKHRSFLFVRQWENWKSIFCLKFRAAQRSKGKRCVLRLGEYCCPLFAWDNYSKLASFELELCILSLLAGVSKSVNHSYKRSPKANLQKVKECFQKTTVQ